MKFLVIFVMLASFLVSCLALKNEICGQPHSMNGDGRISCTAFMPSWSYNAAENSCVEFVYGGCRGNSNRFPNREQCVEQCVE